MPKTARPPLPEDSPSFDASNGPRSARAGGVGGASIPSGGSVTPSRCRCDTDTETEGGATAWCGHGDSPACCGASPVRGRTRSTGALRDGPRLRRSPPGLESEGERDAGAGRGYLGDGYAASRWSVRTSAMSARSASAVRRPTLAPRATRPTLDGGRSKRLASARSPSASMRSRSRERCG